MVYVESRNGMPPVSHKGKRWVRIVRVLCFYGWLLGVALEEESFNFANKSTVSTLGHGSYYYTDGQNCVESPCLYFPDSLLEPPLLRLSDSPSALHVTNYEVVITGY